MVENNIVSFLETALNDGAPTALIVVREPDATTRQQVSSAIDAFLVECRRHRDPIRVFKAPLPAGSRARRTLSHGPREGSIYVEQGHTDVSDLVDSIQRSISCRSRLHIASVWCSISTAALGDDHPTTRVLYIGATSKKRPVESPLLPHAKHLEIALESIQNIVDQLDPDDDLFVDAALVKASLMAVIQMQ